MRGGVRCGDRLLVFDAGTGLQALNRRSDDGRRQADIFSPATSIISPAFSRPPTVRRAASGLGCNLLPERTLAQMARPQYPIRCFRRRRSSRPTSFRDSRQPDAAAGAAHHGAHRPAQLSGPRDRIRVEFGGRAVAYITDTEHRPGTPDEHVMALAKGVDLMIYDCNFTDEEFPARTGWGHSTWQEGVRILSAAGAKRLAMFHHDPDHDDEFLDAAAGTAPQAQSSRRRNDPANITCSSAGQNIFSAGV
jgi:phosphoribosyl 1,2-cyclic phosphodiesterase